MTDEQPTDPGEPKPDGGGWRGLKNNQFALWLAVGIAIGSGLGVALDNVALGSGIGIAIGAGLGAAVSSSQKD